MKIFAEFWMNNADQNPIGSTVSNQLQQVDLDVDIIRSTLSNELRTYFYSVSFSHHYLIASKSKSKEEAIFYISNTSTYFFPIVIYKITLKTIFIKTKVHYPITLKTH